MAAPVEPQALPPDLRAEMEAVHRRLVEATEAIHPAITEFLRTQEGTDPSTLALAILAAGFPVQDTPTLRARRIALAAALELLHRGLDIHKLLVVPVQEDRTPDKALIGGTVLAGDLCFSRAASLAAESESPQVVAIFSRLLQVLSEANLRGLFGQNDQGFDEEAALIHSGILAAGILAGLDPFTREALARHMSDPSAPDSLPEPPIPPHQRSRWQAFLSVRQAGPRSLGAPPVAGDGSGRADSNPAGTHPG